MSKTPRDRARPKGRRGTSLTRRHSLRPVHRRTAFKHVTQQKTIGALHDRSALWR